MRRFLPSLAVATAVVVSPVSVLVQSPSVPEKLGRVHFETSCSESVTDEFDRAMALLHSFEFPAAIAGFEQVLKADPSCGIGRHRIVCDSRCHARAGKGSSVEGRIRDVDLERLRPAERYEACRRTLSDAGHKFRRNCCHWSLQRRQLDVGDVACRRVREQWWTRVWRLPGAAL